jgi:hypothetical protein
MKKEEAYLDAVDYMPTVCGRDFVHGGLQWFVLPKMN